MNCKQTFKLTLNPVKGVDFPKKFGYSGDWKFTGKEITEKQTKAFKLVEVGYQPDFESLKKELEKHGTIPQGQWIMAFKEKYPKGIGEWVGIADSSWVDPGRDVYFPFVFTDVDLSFGWTGSDFDADWRWLVEVQASEL